MIEIEAIDLFVEKDPEMEDDDEASILISLRTPSDREFSQQIKELGAKWDDAAKEWRLVGNEATVKQIGALCKTVFPKLPRRRNRLVAAQVSSSEDASESNPAGKNASSTQPLQTEVTVRVEFLVNRTLKNYRRGQNLKWLKEFRKDFEQNGTASTGRPVEKGNTDNGGDVQKQYLSQLQGEIRELEQSAAEAFEALLSGKKEAVSGILKEAGIQQV